MTASVLQERQTSSAASSVTSIALAYSSTVTASSSLQTFASSGTTKTHTCADSSNGSHTSLEQTNANGVGTFSHFNKDSSASATITVTVSFTADSFPSIWIKEIGGTSGIDGTAHGLNNQANGSGTTRTSPSLTPSTQPGLISALLYNDLSAVGTAGAGFTASTPTSGWDFAQGSSFNSAFGESKRYTSTTALAATFTSVNNTDVSVVAAALYKETVAGGAMVGSSALTFAQTAALTGAGALVSTSALAFGQTGALKGAGVLIGTSALTFGQSGTLTQPGLQGTSALVFAQTGTLTAAGVLAGSSALVFNETGALTGAGVLTGTSALTFAQTAALAAAGVLAGASALTFAQTASLTASGALAGTSALSFAGSATADLPAGALVGSASMTLAASATLSAMGALIGNCQIIINASGFVPSAGPAEVPAGRRIRNIYRVTIDGQVFEFRTLQQALELLEQAKELAAKVAEDDVIWHQPPKPPPVITVSSRELRKAAAETKREIQATYEKAALHAELRMLLELSRRQEEDDTLLLLM